MWHVGTDRGDHMKARFVICANGILTNPKLAKIEGLVTFKGHSFHTSRWDYAYTKPGLSGLANKVVGIIGTRATAVQAVPGLGAAAKELDITDKHREGVRTLLGIYSQGFPNLFVMGGLQASFQFNFTDIAEAQGIYIAACIDHVRRHGCQSLDPTPKAEEW